MLRAYCMGTSYVKNYRKFERGWRDKNTEWKDQTTPSAFSLKYFLIETADVLQDFSRNFREKKIVFLKK